MRCVEIKERECAKKARTIIKRFENYEPTTRSKRRFLKWASA
jgi:hypothetical protein